MGMGRGPWWALFTSSPTPCAGAHVAYAGYVDALVMVQGLVEGPTP